MPEDSQTAELLTHLGSLLESTREGRVNWTKANPTTFVWNTPSPKSAKVALQKVSKSSVASYTFLVTEGNAPKLLVEGDSHEINRLLGELFQAIETSIARKGLDYLRSILPPRQQP